MTDRDRETGSPHLETTTLSAHLEGDLPADEAEGVEAHLARCRACRSTLAELRELVRRAGSLPDRPPETDLWPGIAEAVEASERAVRPGIVTLPDRRPRRTVSFSLPQLAAAALVVMLLSGGGAWVYRGAAAPETAAVDGASGQTSAVRTASVEAGAPPEGYAAELEALERAVSEQRDELDPNTVRILEKNLAVIDRAIRESREALAVDPGNEYLESHLDRAYRTKIEYLREAARLVEWSS